MLVVFSLLVIIDINCDHTKRQKVWGKWTGKGGRGVKRFDFVFRGGR